MMSFLRLPAPLQNVLIVGPIYHKLDKLQEIKNLISEYDWIILNDSIVYVNNEHTIQLVNSVDQLLASGKVIYNTGKLDYVTKSQLDILTANDLYIEKWLKDKPNLTIVDFTNGFKLLITSGGIPPDCHNEEQLHSLDIKSSFIIHSHETYSGGLGYVVSNQPMTKWAPKYYRFSVQMGNTIEGQVYALKVNKYGIQRTIII